MTFTTAHLSVSLDGFVAGPDQSLDTPLGRGGMALHRWHFDPEGDVDREWTASLLAPRGAYVMGRNMFGPVRGPWATWVEEHGAEWLGWWGEEPPYRAPVFVLTHHEREPLARGATTFHFVTGGLAEALRLAREAGDGDVDIAGGASVVRAALAAGEVDELRLDIAPLVLGSGESLWDAATTPPLEPAEVAHSPLATHVRYRVQRP